METGSKNTLPTFLLLSSALLYRSSVLPENTLLLSTGIYCCVPSSKYLTVYDVTLWFPKLREVRAYPRPGPRPCVTTPATFITEDKSICNHLLFNGLVLSLKLKPCSVSNIDERWS